MKKFARYALAFMSVMSISASAAAIPETLYKVCLMNGPTSVDIGTAIYYLMAQSDTPHGPACQYMGVVCNNVPLKTCLNSYLSEGLTISNMSCHEKSWMPYDSDVELDPMVPPDMHFFFDKFAAKSRVFKLRLVLDGVHGGMTGVMSLHPMTMAYGVRFKV